MGQRLTLHNQHARVDVLPEWGAGLGCFDVLVNGSWVPVFRPLQGTPRTPHDLSLYLLAPFSNRVAPGGFVWQGRQRVLPPNVASEACTLHGDAWLQGWQVMDVTPSCAVLTLSSRTWDGWFYDARVEWRLEGLTLHGTLSLTHVSDHPMPYGGGFHPWFIRDGETRLQAQADGWWAEDERHLPTFWHASRSGDASDFSMERTLPEAFINRQHTQWDGRASIAWPSRGVGVDVRAELPLNQFIFYSPGAEADFFCFEPVSHAIDAHHTSAPLQQGLIELQTGQSLVLRAAFEALLL